MISSMSPIPDGVPERISEETPLQISEGIFRLNRKETSEEILGVRGSHRIPRDSQAEWYDIT